MYLKENYITNYEHLKHIIEKCEKEEIISIDTEFIREKTFFPKLCLIQLATSKDCYIIDVLNLKNLSPINKLLNNKKIKKIFHSPRQDIEIFYNLFNRLPKNIFDTQIAYSFLHNEYQISYEKIIFKLLNKKIDKKFQYYEWDLRPLSDEQLEYAVNDVYYLRKLFIRLQKLLLKKNRYYWAEVESDTYLNKQLYINKPEDYWKNIYPSKIKNINILKLKLITSWREKKCIEKNLSRKLIISDQNIIKLIRHCKKINPKLFSCQLSAEEKIFIQNILVDNKNMLKVDCDLDKNDDLFFFNIYKIILNIVSDEYKISSNLIATSSELKKINLKKNNNSIIFKGWRNEIFGEKIRDFLKGKLKIIKNKKKLVLDKN